MGLIAVVNYIIVLAASFIISFIFYGLFDVTWLVMTIISIYFLVSKWYVPTEPKSPLKEGFILGLWLALFTFAIELVLWVYSFGWSYFWHITVLVQYLFIIIVSIFALKSKNEKIILRTKTDKKKVSNWKDRLND
jgi:hypothetical protein